MTLVNGPHVASIRSRALLVEHEHDFALPAGVALREAYRVFPVSAARCGDACAERTIAEQGHQIAIGAVYHRGVGVA